MLSSEHFQNTELLFSCDLRNETFDPAHHRDKRLRNNSGRTRDPRDTSNTDNHHSVHSDTIRNRPSSQITDQSPIPLAITRDRSYPSFSDSLSLVSGIEVVDLASQPKMESSDGTERLSGYFR